MRGVGEVKSRGLELMTAPVAVLESVEGGRDLRKGTEFSFGSAELMVCVTLGWFSVVTEWIYLGNVCGVIRR